MNSGSPCGACKFLRRKCIKGSCIFAPYFGSDQGAAHFAAVHKIFGASNVSKLLLRIPVPELRREAVRSISYEAEARISDPIYGCVATIFALNEQVNRLQAELAVVQAQLASRFTTTAVDVYNQQQQMDDGGSTLPISAQLYSYDNSLLTPPPISASLSQCSSNSTCGGFICEKVKTGEFGILSDRTSTTNYVPPKDETRSLNAMNADIRIHPSIERFVSNHQIDALLKSKVTADIQQTDMNGGDLQAFAHLLLHRQ